MTGETTGDTGIAPLDSTREEVRERDRLRSESLTASRTGGGEDESGMAKGFGEDDAEATAAAAAGGGGGGGGTLRRGWVGSEGRIGMPCRRLADEEAGSG